jgi:EpsD family peptidyl-prolyl cis-trans isomerase
VIAAAKIAIGIAGLLLRRGRSLARGFEVRGKVSFRGGAVICALLLSGCHNEPKGQVIAIVNGHEISFQDLNAELDGLQLPDNVDRKQLRRILLQQVIDRELMVQKAHKMGIDKTPEYVSEVRRGEENLLAGMIGHNVAVTVPLPDERDIQQYIDSHPFQFGRREQLKFDQILFDPPKDRRKLDVLKDTHSLDAAAAALQSIGVAFTRGEGAIDTGPTAPDLAAQIEAAPPGEPILLPQGNQLAVGVITARQPIATPPAAVHLAAARAVRAAALLHESQAQIQSVREKAKIDYRDPELAPAPVARR